MQRSPHPGDSRRCAGTHQMAQLPWRGQSSGTSLERSAAATSHSTTPPTPKFNGADMGLPYVCRYSRNGEEFFGASAGMLPIPCKPHHLQLHCPRGWDVIERGTGRGQQPHGGTQPGRPPDLCSTPRASWPPSRLGEDTAPISVFFPPNLCSRVED